MKEELLDLLTAACVLIASKQGERPIQPPSASDFEAVTGFQVHYVVLAKQQKVLDKKIVRIGFILL